MLKMHLQTIRQSAYLFFCCWSCCLLGVIPSSFGEKVQIQNT
jgi:hypothetical protein